LSCYPCSVSSFLYPLPATRYPLLRAQASRAQAPQESRNMKNVIPAEAGMTFFKTGINIYK